MNTWIISLSLSFLFGLLAEYFSVKLNNSRIPLVIAGISVSLLGEALGDPGFSLQLFLSVLAAGLGLVFGIRMFDKKPAPKESQPTPKE